MTKSFQTKPTSTRLITYLALSTTFVIIGAIIKIPLAVPMTLQFFIVALLPFLLGEYSVFCILIYITIGLCGLPVFASGGGLPYVFQPSFGYVLGFLVACPICGKILNPYPNNNRPTIKTAVLAVALFLIIVYLVGAIYYLAISKLYLNSSAPIIELLAVAILTTIWKDLLFCLLIIPIGIKLQKVVGLKK